jgi:hypothetical protein
MYDFAYGRDGAVGNTVVISDSAFEQNTAVTGPTGFFDTSSRPRAIGAVYCNSVTQFPGCNRFNSHSVLSCLFSLNSAFYNASDATFFTSSGSGAGAVALSYAGSDQFSNQDLVSDCTFNNNSGTRSRRICAEICVRANTFSVCRSRRCSRSDLQRCFECGCRRFDFHKQRCALSSMFWWCIVTDRRAVPGSQLLVDHKRGVVFGRRRDVE